jgi:AraC-like DNA-binding protein
MSSTTAIEPALTERLDPHPIGLVANVVELLEAARGQFERDREAAKVSINRATFMLRSELQRHRAAEQADCGTGKLAGWQVLRLRAYVDSHLGETIHVSDLSAIARRSTAHFCRAFKRTFDQTPHAYITAQRLERAKWLMLESGEQLSAIAVSCGFTDQAHLSKLFRQHTGETPGGWRRRNAVDEEDEPLAWALRS